MIQKATAVGMALLLTVPLLAGSGTVQATPADVTGSFEPGLGIRIRITNMDDDVVVVEGLQTLSIAGGLVLLGRDTGWHPAELEPGESALRTIGVVGLGPATVSAAISYTVQGEQMQTDIEGSLLVLGPLTVPLDG